MTDKESTGKARLQEALRLSDEAYAYKHPPMEREVQYSEQYLKGIKRLTNQTRSPFYGYFRTIGSRVAIAMAAILIIFGCSMTVDAVRAPVTEFFETISITIYKELSALDSEPVHTEHDFSVLATEDPNKHYYRCKDKRCKEKYGEEFHTYVVNEEKRRLECSICGRVAK